MAESNKQRMSRRSRRRLPPPTEPVSAQDSSCDDDHEFRASYNVLRLVNSPRLMDRLLDERGFVCQPPPPPNRLSQRDRVQPSLTAAESYSTAAMADLTGMAAGGRPQHLTRDQQNAEDPQMLQVVPVQCDERSGVDDRAVRRSAANSPTSATGHHGRPVPSAAPAFPFRPEYNQFRGGVFVSERVNLQLDVSFADHSFVIGRQGKSVAAVMHATGCSVHFPDCNKQPSHQKSNQVSIVGSPAGVPEACRKLRSLLPLVFCFVAHGEAYQRTARDPNFSRLIELLQNQCHMTISWLPMPAELSAAVVAVRGRQTNLDLICDGVRRLRDALLMAAGGVGDDGDEEVYLGIEVERHSMEFAFGGLGATEGDGVANVRDIEAATHTRFSVGQLTAASDTQNLRTVRICGRMENVFGAWLQFMDLLPVVLAVAVPIIDVVESKESFSSDEDEQETGCDCDHHRRCFAYDADQHEAFSSTSSAPAADCWFSGGIVPGGGGGRRQRPVHHPVPSMADHCPNYHWDCGFSRSKPAAAEDPFAVRDLFQRVEATVDELNELLWPYDISLESSGRSAVELRLLVRGPEKYVRLMIAVQRALTAAATQGSQTASTATTATTVQLVRRAMDRMPLSTTPANSNGRRRPRQSQQQQQQQQQETEESAHCSPCNCVKCQLLFPTGSAGRLAVMRRLLPDLLRFDRSQEEETSKEKPDFGAYSLESTEPWPPASDHEFEALVTACASNMPHRSTNYAPEHVGASAHQLVPEKINPAAVPKRDGRSSVGPNGAQGRESNAALSQHRSDMQRLQRKQTPSRVVCDLEMFSAFGHLQIAVPSRLPASSSTAQQRSTEHPRSASAQLQQETAEARGRYRADVSRSNTNDMYADGRHSSHMAVWTERDGQATADHQPCHIRYATGRSRTAIWTRSGEGPSGEGQGDAQHMNNIASADQWWPITADMAKFNVGERPKPPLGDR